MADPISIIGAIGAMANIIDVVAKSVRAISALRDRWKEADLTLLTLASQLTALRGALDKIREWMENDLEGDPHHQLVMDLDVTVKCCQLLMSKMELLIGELGDTVDEPLDFGSIVKLVFRGKSIEDVQRLIEQQTGALTLLLTACNCKAISEQKALLEKTKTRKVLSRNQLDSASLYVNRDSASIASRFTDNLSKLSVIFEFDNELFSSKIYQQVLRGSIKDALRKQQGSRVRVPKSKTDEQRSERIDNDLRRDKLKARGQVKMVLMGDPGAKAEFMKIVKLIHSHDVTDPITQRKPIDAQKDNLSIAVGVSEFKLAFGDQEFCLIDAIGRMGSMARTGHFFEGAVSVCFFVDLTRYDQHEDENWTPEPGLKAMFDIFQSVVNSIWFQRSSIILYLYNAKAFGEKLQISPLEDFFPYYSEGNDVEKAKEFIVENFRRLDTLPNRDFYSHFFEPNDWNVSRTLVTSVNDTIINKNLKSVFPDSYRSGTENFNSRGPEDSLERQSWHHLSSV